MRDMVFAAILGAPNAKAEPGPKRVAARAVALRAVLHEAGAVLSTSEQRLLGEWLDRLAAGPRSSAAHTRSRKRSRRSG